MVIGTGFTRIHSGHIRIKQKPKTTSPSRTSGITPRCVCYFGMVHDVHLSDSCVLLVSILCLVSNAVYISGLSILGYPFDFLYRLLTTHSLFCVWCTQCCLYLRIVHSWLPLRFSLSFTYYPQSVVCLVYSMLSISKACPFLVTPSMFSIVYLLPTVCSVDCVLKVSYIPGLSILDWPFDCLCRLFTIYSLFCVLCTQCFIYPRIVLYCLPLRLSLSFIYYLQSVLCLVYSMFHIS